jgi:hypothetical protein
MVQPYLCAIKGGGLQIVALVAVVEKSIGTMMVFILKLLDNKYSFKISSKEFINKR